MKVSREKAKIIRLVSTSRARSQVLFRHAAGIRALLKASEGVLLEEHAREYASVPHVLLLFDKFAGASREEQIAVEFPNEYTRDAKIMKEFFAVYDEPSEILEWSLRRETSPINRRLPWRAYPKFLEDMGKLRTSVAQLSVLVGGWRPDSCRKTYGVSS